MNTSRAESDLTGPLEPGLYIVATPIGNLGDITLRAVDVLSRCDLIACEDTRVTGKLLKALGIKNRMQRYDDHASALQRMDLVERMQTEAVALVSDAGTPLVADPGYRLSREAREQGVQVTTLPGACAAIAGLTLAGLPNDRFLFAGFIPAKEKARGDLLDELAQIKATMVFYETGPRLTKSLSAIQEKWPNRDVSVARELTKLHEECRTGVAGELLAHYSENPAKGEIVLLVAPPEDQVSDEDPEILLREALETMSPSKAAGHVAKVTGHDRKELYSRAIALKEP